jgi:hypothetical protein
MSSPEFGGQVPFFLQNFLGRPASSLPKGAQWVLMFEGAFSPSQTTPDYSDILPVKAIKKGIKFEPREFQIDSALDATLIKDYQQTKGCLFAQGVQIPGESYTINPEGLQQSGYIRSFLGGGRDTFQSLDISFLETNVSFVDNVIRPWVIATSHLGMIARSGESNYRCNISVYKLGVSIPSEPPHVIQKFTFFGACPISVTGEEYNYSQSTNHVNREATFTYHYYNSETVANNPSITNNTTNNPIYYSTKTYQVNTTSPTTLTTQTQQPRPR